MDATTPVETVMRTGGPADVIADVATERKAGLIVMGLQGAGGLLGSAPGSVTYRVLLLAPAPVLAVPDGAAGALFTLD
jgi:nucleotide-binding universal stress UspA family protein